MSWSAILGLKTLFLFCLITLLSFFNTGADVRGSRTEPANKPAAQELAAEQQFYSTGTNFLSTCSAVTRVEQGSRSGTDVANARACDSYVAGLADGVAIQHIWSKSHGDQTKAAFCVQFENVPAPQLVSSVLQYLRENPERRRFRAAIAVEEVLHKKFPCR